MSPASGPAAASRTRPGAAARTVVQKSGAGVPAYTRWVNRRLGRVAAGAAASGGVAPNGVTLASAALSLAGIAVLIAAPAGPITGLVCATLLAAGYVLDSADGQLARLTGRAGPSGEWLDHVVDAARMPLLHVGVAVAVALHRPDDRPLAAVALAFSVLSSAQFLSQILAEQLSARHGRSLDEPNGAAKSLALLPVDPGVLLWSFVAWAWAPAFALIYTSLFLCSLVHAGASMRRKYVRLGAPHPENPS